MTDTETPGSPLWWLRTLHADILRRRPPIRKLTDYYEGRHNLAFTSEKFRESFGGLFRSFADNWTALVVDSCEERLEITGVRLPQDPASSAASGMSAPDETVWRIFQANDLDHGSQVAHTEALLHGESFVTVWPSEDPRTPDVTVESAASAIVRVDPKRPRRRLAGLRLYVDEYGYEHAELMLPDAVYLYRSPKARSSVISSALSASWIPDEAVAPAGLLPNPFGLVPIVPISNRPRLWTSTTEDLLASSEIASVLPLQDAANKLIADLLVSSEAYAMPQRWLTGYERERDPDTGEPLPFPFRPTSKVWALEDPEARFGSFPAGDLSSYIRAIEMIVQHIASITRTPPHYLQSNMADRLSGESIKAAESGLVAKVRKKQIQYGNSWEAVVRLIGAAIGDPRLAAATGAEIIWKDPESRTEAQHVDAMVKLRSGLDLPAVFLWEKLGMTPAEIQRAKDLQADEALLGALGASLPPLAPPVVTPDPAEG